MESRLDDYLKSESGKYFAIAALVKAVFVPCYCRLIREQSGFSPEAVEGCVRSAEKMWAVDGPDAVELLYYRVWVEEYDASRRRCGDREQAKKYTAACKALRKLIEPFMKLLGIELKNDARSVTDRLSALRHGDEGG